MANKIKYGLSKCYYAIWNEAEDTYATPVAIPGAVSLTLDQQGGETRFRADNIDYWTTYSNNGYSGSFEIAKLPESFKVDVLGEQVDATTGIQYELATAKPKAFALLCQMEGDEESVRMAFYNCKCSRPSQGSQTTSGDSIEPVTESIDINASARPVDNVIKGAVAEGGASFDAWFTEVKKPTITQGE